MRSANNFSPYQYLEKVILLIIFISVLPVIAEAVKAYRKPKEPVEGPRV